MHPHTIKSFLPSFLSLRHSREKRYQALARFSVLIATKSWARTGNEANCSQYVCTSPSLLLTQIMDHGSPVLWDDIAGLEFAKATIKEIVVWPMLRP